MPADRGRRGRPPAKPAPCFRTGPQGRSCDCARLQPEHHAHGLAAPVRLVAHAAVVDEGRGLAGGQLVLTHKKMDVDAQRGVADDFVALCADGVSGVLALPLKVDLTSTR